MSQNSFHSIAVRAHGWGYVVNSTRVCLLVCALLVCLMAFSICVVDKRVTAQGTFPDPNAGCPHATCGEVSPLIPMQSTEAVHMGLVWKRNSTYAQNIVSRKVS